MQYLDLHEKKKHGTDLFPFEYYYIEKDHPRYQMNYHWHTEYEFIRVLKGSLTMTLNEKSFEAVAGELIFVHGGILHAGVPSDCIYECLVFDLDLFRRLPPCAPYIQRVMDRSALVYHHFTAAHKETLRIAQRLFASMSDRHPGYEMAVISQVYQFFAHVFSAHLYLDAQPRTSARDVRKTMQLRKVIDYINQNMGNQVTLHQMAEAASMSPKYFCRFFKTIVHRSPIDYVNYYRVECASHFLISGDMTVAEIAQHCGYNDSSFFIKQFRKYKGTTPKQYRMG